MIHDQQFWFSVFYLESVSTECQASCVASALTVGDAVGPAQRRISSWRIWRKVTSVRRSFCQVHNSDSDSDLLICCCELFEIGWRLAI